jgi:hypothetical protein
MSRPLFSYSFSQRNEEQTAKEFPSLLNMFQRSQGGPISFRRKRRGFDRPLSSLSFRNDAMRRDPPHLLLMQCNEDSRKAPSSLSSNAMQRGEFLPRHSFSTRYNKEATPLILPFSATQRGGLSPRPSTQRNEEEISPRHFSFGQGIHALVILNNFCNVLVKIRNVIAPKFQPTNGNPEHPTRVT